jgi:N-acetylglucosamine-6-sulfatase
LVLSLDLVPTLLELGGVPIPEDLHGRSRVPLLGDRTWTPRTSFLIEHLSDNVFPRVRNVGYQAVRAGRWKNFHYNDLDAMDELYDLESDPFELRNRIDDPATPVELPEMKDELGRLLDSSK